MRQGHLARNHEPDQRAGDGPHEGDAGPGSEAQGWGRGGNQRGKAGGRDKSLEQRDGQHEAAEPEEGREPQRNDRRKRGMRADRRLHGRAPY